MSLYDDSLGSPNQDLGAQRKDRDSRLYKPVLIVCFSNPADQYVQVGPHALRRVAEPLVRANFGNSVVVHSDKLTKYKSNLY